MARRAAYFDTTVLVKRYARETGSDHAVSLIRRYKIISAATAPLEMISAIRRKLAAADLEQKAYDAILKPSMNFRIPDLVEFRAIQL